MKIHKVKSSKAIEDKPVGIGILSDYLRSHTKAILLFFLFSLIFFVIFLLYDLPIAAVGYAVAICFFAGIVLLVPDFLRFCRDYQLLVKMPKEIGITLDKLPETRKAMERLYQELIRRLFLEKQQCVEESSRRYKELNEYYTIWAHQIKTPIAAMGLILQREDTPVNRELNEELKRISQYVEMVLVVLRLDADSTDYVLKEYDLDEMVRQAVRKNATQFIYRKLTLRYEPLNVKVLTDEKWLVFVIDQVLSNALKYTKNGTIEIFLEEPEILCIRDTGIGIAPEDLPRVFEKGYTGYNGRSDKKASGIGLYLCRRICGKLGHVISAESEVGVGTTVRISLGRQEMSFE